jgi:hypothetical protein
VLGIIAFPTIVLIIVDTLTYLSNVENAQMIAIHPSGDGGFKI